MSPGILSDRRAVIAIIIGAILAIIAYFVIRPIDTTISYVVFGVAAVGVPSFYAPGTIIFQTLWVLIFFCKLLLLRLVQ